MAAGSSGLVPIRLRNQPKSPMPHFIQSLYASLSEVALQLRFALWRPWLRVCPLPTLQTYWSMLNAYDWIRCKQLAEEGGVPSTKWSRCNRPLMFKIELLAYRSAVHEELLAEFFCAAAADIHLPARP